METLDLLAKVLANENITVRKAKISTACFDLVNRELMLPMWEKLDPVVETMLVEHETGHALFTPKEYKDEVQARPYMSTIFNVVEDARIERLFKEKYPGSRKDFTAAAKVFRDTDFFEIKDVDLSTLNLIDRINLYSKLGILTGVKFSKEELPFVSRNSSVVTFNEVVTLANDIYAFMKSKQIEQKKQASEQEQGDGTQTEEDEDQDPTDNQFDQSDDDADGDDYDSDDYDGEPEWDNTADTEEADEKELTSKTDQLYSTKLSEAAGNGTPPTYFVIDEDYDSLNVVGYKDILKTLNQKIGSCNRDYFDRFKGTVTKQVGHLVQQFELKKAAETYARRRITKTGFIDTNKISQYQIKDDIFRRSIKVKEGQNHGIVMLLDWSRSMAQGHTIYHSIDQVMQLVMFCRSVGIPYRVYAFKDHVKDWAYNYNYVAKNHMGDQVELLEFFNNDMTLSEHNEMMAYMSQRSVLSVYRLHYTPLAPAILMMRKIIPAFKEKYRIQKLNFITFTDGANTTRIISRKGPAAVYATDSVMKKNFMVYRGSEDDISITEVNAFYRIIKERCNCTVTTFFATATRNLRDALRYSGVGMGAGELALAKRSEFTSKGFFMLTGYGRDAIYMVSPSILRTAELSLAGLTSEMNSSAIARTLKNSSKSSLKNKILIEKLSDTLC